VRKQFFCGVALTWTFLILFFCLTQSSNIPIIGIGIPHLDKLVHVFFHFVFTLLWFLFLRNQLKSRSNIRLLVISFSLSVFYGIGIEIMQGVFTTTRKADLFDVLANMSGALLAAFVIQMFFKIEDSK
jgi:VanZ family protein